ncbi:MAG: flagellar biosynthesis protein FlgN [Planctomycetes bacterium]|nr:flagellar biosynthesis protein FlgN [Planctomycetota bacterium]
MTTDNPRILIAQLDALLDRERSALLNGDLESLATLTSDKEALMAQIDSSHALKPAHLETVHAKVTRNQALLNSALEGIRAVADRMADLRRVRQSLETYDKSGRRTEIRTRAGSSVEKRA